jgi:hypothetical protein
MIKHHPIHEQDLIDLGFEKTLVSKHESGHEYDFYYYVYVVSKHTTLITNEDDAAKLSTWKVYIFDDEYLYFDEIEPLTTFLTSFSYAKITNKNGDSVAR